MVICGRETKLWNDWLQCGPNFHPNIFSFFPVWSIQLNWIEPGGNGCLLRRVQPRISKATGHFVCNHLRCQHLHRGNVNDYELVFDSLSFRQRRAQKTNEIDRLNKNPNYDINAWWPSQYSTHSLLWFSLWRSGCWPWHCIAHHSQDPLHRNSKMICSPSKSGAHHANLHDRKFKPRTLSKAAEKTSIRRVHSMWDAMKFVSKSINCW